MKRVRSLPHLVRLAEERRAVITGTGWRAFSRKPLPAAWIVNLGGLVLNRIINAGLFIYEPKKKGKKS